MKQAEEIPPFSDNDGLNWPNSLYIKRSAKNIKELPVLHRVSAL